MTHDMGDYEGMLFIVHQKGGWVGLGAGFLDVIFPSVAEAQTYCFETAKLLGDDVTLQPAKEHNGRLVGAPVQGTYKPKGKVWP